MAKGGMIEEGGELNDEGTLEEKKMLFEKDVPEDIDKTMIDTIKVDLDQIKLAQEEAITTKGKPEYIPLDGPLVENECKKRTNEYLRPDGSRGYFTEMFFLTSKGEILYSAVDVDEESEFNQPWEPIEFPPEVQ